MYLSFVKPFFDIFFSLILIIPCAFVTVILCLFIRMESAGSPIFRQTRVGKKTRHFHLLKLRSMRKEAEHEGPYFTSKNDKRITKMGNFVRKTSLDEIPQLINILKGEMSFIGPRPDVPIQEKNYTPEQWQERHKVKPGITGLAQSTVRSRATHEERINLDLYYVRNASFWLDFKIFIMTIKVVLLRSHAN